MSFRSRRLSLLGTACLVALAVAASSSAIRAEDFATDVPDRIWIDLGGTTNEVSTQVALGTPSGIGATIDFEDIFDLPGDKTTARLLGTVRISEQRRWIDFGFVDIDRSGTRVIREDVEFGDHTFLADGEVTARFATQFIYAAFRYDFLHEEKIRVSGSAGLTFLRLTTSLEGEGNFVLDPDGNPIANDFKREESVGAPVPMVGMNIDWALTKRLVVRMYSRFFRLNLSTFDGGLYENGIRLNWYFAKHFGLGLGFDRTALKIKELEVDNENVVKAGYDISGVGLYINLAF